MKNRDVGILIMCIAIFMTVIILLFNVSLKKVVDENCRVPPCSMSGVINVQTGVSMLAAILIFLLGLFLALSKEHKKIRINRQIIHRKKRFSR